MPEHQQTQQSTESKTTFQKQATPLSQTPASNPYSIIQRAKINPNSLTYADVMQLQRTIGNRAVGMLLTGIGNTSTVQQAPVQRQEIPEEEEPLQGKMVGTVQRQEIPEEEEPLQGKFESTPEKATCPSGSVVSIIQKQEIPEEEEPLQGKFENKPEQMTCPSCFTAPIVQRQELEDEEKPLQGKMIETVQRQEIPEEEEPLQTKKENNTGMPDNLKVGVENLSGIDMSDVRVHYNSNKSADVGALAYTQGTNIHVAPGQERHLPHEAWHVVQQMQGRVRATGEVGGMPLNDSRTLEAEADSMGWKALQQYAQVEKQKENRSRVVDYSVAQTKRLGKQGFSFVDNRTEIIAQQKRQSMANKSQEVKQLRAIQRIAHSCCTAKVTHKCAPTEVGGPGSVVQMVVEATVGNRTYKSTDRQHAEESLFDSGKYNNGDFTVEMNAWPCTGERGHNCHKLFIDKSAGRIITVNVTGDHGGYAKNHGLDFGSTGTIKYNNRKATI